MTLNMIQILLNINVLSSKCVSNEHKAEKVLVCTLLKWPSRHFMLFLILDCFDWFILPFVLIQIRMQIQCGRVLSVFSTPIFQMMLGKFLYFNRSHQMFGVANCHWFVYGGKSHCVHFFCCFPTDAHHLKRHQLTCVFSLFSS